MPNLRTCCRNIETLSAAMAGVLLRSGGDDTANVRARSFLIAAWTSLLAIGVVYACHVLGTLSEHAFFQVAAAVVAALVGFFLVFRAGLNRAAADPSLTAHQMVVATLVVMYANYSADAGAAGVFPIILLMIFMFGVLRLRMRALLLFALFILTAHAATTVLRAYVRPSVAELDVRVLQWITLAVTLPWFALMGGHIKGLRAKLAVGNVRLGAALKATQASEARLAEAQRIAGLGSWTYRPATKRAHWSPEMYRIFGAEPEHPVPLADEFLRRVHPDDQQHYRELIRPAIDAGRGFDSEYRILSPEGEVRWVHVAGEAVVDKDGKTILLRGTALDVTERKAHEDALERAKDEATAARAILVEAIESLPEAFALFDADDRLILANRRYAEAFTSFSRFEDIAGMSFGDIVRASVAKGEPIAPEYANDVEAWVAERVWHHRNPGPEPREIELGGQRWLQVTERRTSFGGIVGVRGDITDRKHLEQRQAMEHAVTRLMADSASVGETMPKVIRTICETLGWDCGARWRLDAKDNLLRCEETWAVADGKIAQFSAFSARQTYAPATAGLIRRVMKTRQPVWVADVSCEPGFKRAAAAASAGLHGAFAFPIRVGSEMIGAMEFFIRNVRQPDTALLRVLDSIGLQVGPFIARAATQEQLTHLAHYDLLTGLPNRNLFNELLVHAFAKARRSGTRLAVLFVDLDNFKQVNDRYGHDAGDHLLATFTQRLKKCLRQSDTFARHGLSDTAARVGGDEFVVLVDDVVQPSDVAALARRILEATTEPFDLAGPHGHVSASIGIGIYPEDGSDIDSLIKAADSAMYDAKQSGRNAYRFFSAAAQPRASVVT